MYTPNYSHINNLDIMSATKFVSTSGSLTFVRATTLIAVIPLRFQIPDNSNMFVFAHLQSNLRSWQQIKDPM